MAKETFAAKNQEQALLNRLLQVPAFKGVSSRHLQVMLKVAKPRTVAARQVLCRSGDPCSGLWILLKGTLAVRESGESTRRVQPVALLGEVAMLSGEQHTEEMVGVEESMLLEVPSQVFGIILTRSPEICQRLCRNVVGLLSVRLQQVNEALSESARTRAQLVEKVREAEVELNDLRVIHGYRE